MLSDSSCDPVNLVSDDIPTAAAVGTVQITVDDDNAIEAKSPQLC